MLAIIPARGGSKGLPGKNIRPLNGEPLIAYTIKAALGSSSISKTIVDTNSPEIADIARFYGAETPYLRPAALAGDTASTRDVCLHSLKWFEDHQGISWKEFVILQPTSPFRESRHIDEAVKLFYRDNIDSVISVTEYMHPIQWAVQLNEHGMLVKLQQMPNQRQMAEKYYHPNGAIYIYKTEAYKINSEKIFEKTKGYVMPNEISIDIDTLADFQYAQWLMSKQKAIGV